ncbi:MAG: response regulator [Candidatus Methylomirabilia bacterium]
MADSSRAPRILCVDDDLDFLTIVTEYFTYHGFDVLTAANGEEALSQVTRRSPSAVILDLYHPGLGGLGTLDHIRKLDPDIAVILVSGVSNALEMLEETGVDVAAAFAKPVNLNQVLEALVRAGVAPQPRRQSSETPRAGSEA